MNLQPAKTEFTNDEHAEIRRKIEVIKASEGLIQAEISRQSEVPESTLSGYLKNRYGGDIDVVAAKLHRWLQSRERAAELRMRLPVAPLFQPLFTSTRILSLLDMAREMGRMVSVTGDPGTSKTATARQYCAETSRAWLATMDPSTAGVPTMLLEVLQAMGEPETKGTPQVLARRVVTKATEAKGVIVIDEAQHLSDKALEQIRAINDTTRRMGSPIGIALIGNETMKNRVAGNGTKIEFAQVSSRIAQRRVFKRPDPRDVVSLAQAWADANKEILGKTELDYLQRIAAMPGGLRNVEMTFEGALLVSLAQSEPLTLDHLRGAFSQLSGLANAA
jgi:DNA transposition AAA+ family ATPase